ncbi:MAG: DUF192 domain-containing protein [Waddliaceae bacterium]
MITQWKRLLWSLGKPILLALVIGMSTSAMGKEITSLTLEYAVTPSERAEGLMFRPRLPENHGMLFVFTHPQKISLWMLNCLIDLSVAFLDESHVIREIRELRAYPHIKSVEFFAERLVTSSFDACYALEMEKGWFEAHGIESGDRLFFRQNSPDAYLVHPESNNSGLGMNLSH